MSDREARCYADLIMGSYLWAGSPATVFVTKWTTQEGQSKNSGVLSENYCAAVGHHSSQIKGPRGGSPETPGMGRESGRERQGHDMQGR